ncbi:hypothetical protein D3C77_628500 [compost metagenome]
MIDAHSLGRQLQRLALLRRDALQCLLEARTRQDQVGHAGDFQTVEALGQLYQRRIAACAYRLDDLQHTRVHAVVGDAFPAQQMIQMPGEIGIGSIESANSGGNGHGGPHGWLGIGNCSWSLCTQRPEDQALKRR